MGYKLALPVYCSPTTLQRLFHHQGERAVAAAAAKYGTMFGVSSLGTVSLEHPDELRVDLDPGPGVSWDFVRRVTLLVVCAIDPDPGVVGHELRRHATHEGQCPDMRADPIRQSLGQGRLSIGVIRRAHHRDEDLGWPDLAGSARPIV